MEKTDVKHTVLHNGNYLLCEHCGEKSQIRLPMSVDIYVKKIEAFNQLHADCTKSWSPPIIRDKTSIEERQFWWLTYGNRGESSESIFRHFSPGLQNYSFNHPLDPSDFKRCYDLLELFPEWKAKINELEIMSETWRNIIQNWDKLTELLEQAVKTGNSNEMFDFMKKLGC